MATQPSYKPLTLASLTVLCALAGSYVISHTLNNDSPAVAEGYGYEAETLAEDASLSLNWYGETYDVRPYLTEYTSADYSVSSQILVDVMGFTQEVGYTPDGDTDSVFLSYLDKEGNRLLLFPDGNNLIYLDEVWTSTQEMELLTDDAVSVSLPSLIQTITDDVITVDSDPSGVTYTVLSEDPLRKATDSNISKGEE